MPRRLRLSSLAIFDDRNSTWVTCDILPAVCQLLIFLFDDNLRHISFILYLLTIQNDNEIMKLCVCKIAPVTIRVATDCGPFAISHLIGAIFLVCMDDGKWRFFFSLEAELWWYLMRGFVSHVFLNRCYSRYSNNMLSLPIVSIVDTMWHQMVVIHDWNRFHRVERCALKVIMMTPTKPIKC